MADMEESLTKKIGGVPVWGWALGIVGIVVAYAWWRARSQDTTTTGTEIIPNDSSNVSGNGSLAGLSPSIAGSGLGTGTDDNATPTTQSWLQSAINAAEANGIDPVTALGALNTFLNGGTLTGNQGSIVSQAIESEGLPPNYSSSLAATTAPDASLNTTSGSGSTSQSGPNPFLAQIDTISNDIMVDTTDLASNQNKLSSLQAQLASATGSAKTKLQSQIAATSKLVSVRQAAINVDNSTLSRLQAQAASFNGGN